MTSSAVLLLEAHRTCPGSTVADRLATQGLLPTALLPRGALTCRLDRNLNKRVHIIFKFVRVDKKSHDEI